MIDKEEYGPDKQAEETEKTKLRAVTYLRVASARKEDTLAIQRQRYACKWKARELGAEIVREYADFGISAASLNRAELQRMRWELSDLDADYVIMYNTYSLAASQTLFIELYERIASTGTRLIVVTESGFCVFCGAVFGESDEHGAL